jgi:tRNA-2-methylthio-N6-dimethylallyladenosine synthase
VLVEGPSERAKKHEAHSHGDDELHADGTPHDDVHGPLQLVGRTNCDRIVVFDGNPRQIGRILPVTIYDANSFTLFGEVVTEHVGPEVYSISL